MIMEKGMITMSSSPAAAARGGASRMPLANAGELDLTPGALWRRVQTGPKNIILGKVIGLGAHSEVCNGKFQGKSVAVKIFRNTTEEKAFREIEMLFSLR